MKDELEHHRRIKKLSDYEAIGTVEEFKALKEKSFFNFDSPIVRIDEKSYNKAIDEFAERLKTVLDRKFSFGTSNKFKLFNSIDEIAEELKGEEYGG